MVKRKDETQEAVEEVAGDTVEEVISLERYLEQVTVHEGLIASFTYEGKYNDPSMLEPKTLEGWNLAFQSQSNRVYE